MFSALKIGGIRWIHTYRRVFLGVLRFAFKLVPLSMGLTFIVTTSRINRRIANFMDRAYAPLVVSALKKNPKKRFAGRSPGKYVTGKADVLLRVGAYSEVVDILSKSNLSWRSEVAALQLSNAHFELADFEGYCIALQIYDAPTVIGNVWILQHRAWNELLTNRQEAAGKFLVAMATLNPEMWCAHQNLSARNLAQYRPTAIDLGAGVYGLLYDAYNLLGQRVTHVGRGDLGASLYGKAIHAQSVLNQAIPKVSANLLSWLRDNRLELPAVKIIPWEWSTQIGHLGMMEILFRMRALGWWKGKAIILPHPEHQKVANRWFLSLFEQLDDVVIAAASVSAGIQRELFSLQRYYGLAFNAWKGADGAVVPWQEAGALAMREWECKQKRLPILDAFDARFQANTHIQRNFSEVKSSWGMSVDDWYVCLHMRDSAFYGESAGTGQTHRNAEVTNYLETVRYITEKGGWVIKLGGPASPRLPSTKRVIDYARSKQKSELLDLLLIRNAKLFIGTTSGLTNIAISFGLPAALVNCITTDAQLWSASVRFIPKPIRLTDGGVLSQRDITSAPWRWRMFSAELLLREGATQQENSSDEILEVVKELEAFVDDKSDLYESRYPNAGGLFSQWNESLGLKHFYGMARPSLYFLHKHQKHFLPEASLDA